ncbi:hypothetical protein SCLCIDRAFT_1217732 [Scleroderma citrinum Foug A]|uniref:Uncharacterized protein n=1 Tax=Scleroderma citrinum Foug A TaxID=1036808 RepID=A0A0C3DTU7_9AGAM|nr:hypothetical protein SCLCIDRAFT_1217732 [Scleroderma citrinum Foug A]
MTSHGQDAPTSNESPYEPAALGVDIVSNHTHTRRSGLLVHVLYLLRGRIDMFRQSRTRGHVTAVTTRYRRQNAFSFGAISAASDCRLAVYSPSRTY